MTTNSKNSRMKYRGFNNGRIYRANLAIKKEKREIERKLVNGFSYLGCVLGFLIRNAVLRFTYRKHNAKMEQQAVEQKIFREKQRVQERATYNKRKQQRQDKRNNIIDQWTKHMGKFVNGKYITVSLDEYTKMTDKQRKEWNEDNKQESKPVPQQTEKQANPFGNLKPAEIPTRLHTFSYQKCGEGE